MDGVSLYANMASSTPQSANIVIVLLLPLFSARCALQLSDSWQLCYNFIMHESVFDRETDTSGAGGCEGWKKTHQIRTNQPFCDLQQISNLADSWGIFSVSNIKLWYFLSGQADRGLSPKAEPGCSFSWCLCCWRRSWCPPVRGVSRTMVTAAGERAVWKHF